MKTQTATHRGSIRPEHPKPNPPMNKDFILSLTKPYRRFKDKDRRTEVFTHFLAVLALKFVHDTQDKHFFGNVKPATAKMLLSVWSNLSPAGTTRRLDNAVQALSTDNAATFGRMFQTISFEKLVFQNADSDRELKLLQLLEDIDTISFGTKGKAADELGYSIGYMIEKFTEENFHKDGFLYTPRSIANLMAQMARLEPNHTVHDPGLGIGTLLVQAAKVGKLSGTALSGQDIQPVYVELARYHLFFNGAFDVSLESADSLLKSKPAKQTYDCVLVQPPFQEKLLLPANARDFLQTAKKRRKNGTAAADNGTTPVTKAKKPSESSDFLTYALDALNETGKAVLVVPHGLLFKTGTALQVRRKLVGNNLVEAVIDLPPHVFYSSKINSAILLLNKAKTHSDVLFVDASDLYEADRRRNKIRVAHSKQVMDLFRKFASHDGLAYRATQREVENEDNNYNLTAKRYVQQSEKPTEVNLKALVGEIESLEKTLSGIQEKIRRETAELVTL